MLYTDPIKSQLYTRKQVAELTGIDDSALNYWMREGLLRPIEGGGGKGNHRRFDYVQVNIAAVFGQLRRFGLNIAALRTLADLLQSAVQLGTSVQLHPAAYSTAAALADRIDDFRRGEPVMLKHGHTNDEAPADMSLRERHEWEWVERPAVSEKEVWDHWVSNAESEYDIDAIKAAAKLFGPHRQVEARIYVDLTVDIIEPGYSSEVTWLLGLKEDGGWDIESGTEGRFFENIHGMEPGDFGPGIFVPLGAVLRKIWELKTPRQLMRERRAVYTQKRLALAGIETRCFADDKDDDDDDAIVIEYDEPVTWDQIQTVLNERPSFRRKEDSK
jgi:DNA-binding transcriptional MerR regulator